MHTPRPYTQRRLSNGSVLREFREDTNPEDLVWHQDRLERSVTVIKCKGWHLQLENGLPFPMNEGYTYTIPARSWHRIVRGTGSLVLSIQERKNNMAIRLTENRLRRIIREEAQRLLEMGMGGRDEYIADPSPYLLGKGTKVWDTRSGPSRTGTITYPPDFDEMVGVKWDDSARVDYVDIRVVAAL